MLNRTRQWEFNTVEWCCCFTSALLLPPAFHLTACSTLYKNNWLTNQNNKGHFNLSWTLGNITQPLFTVIVNWHTENKTCKTKYSLINSLHFPSLLLNKKCLKQTCESHKLVLWPQTLLTLWRHNCAISWNCYEFFNKFWEHISAVTSLNKASP